MHTSLGKREIEPIMHELVYVIDCSKTWKYITLIKTILRTVLKKGGKVLSVLHEENLEAKWRDLIVDTGGQ